jgi:RHS repeat-associated protein
VFFGYAGKPHDGDTGMNYYLNRWYDPRTGKWLSEDPAGFAAGDANLTRYVGNSPTMYVDPLGLVQAFAQNGSANTTSGPALQEGSGATKGKFIDQVKDLLEESHITDLEYEDDGLVAGNDCDDFAALAETFFRRKLKDDTDVVITIVHIRWLSPHPAADHIMVEDGHVVLRIAKDGESIIVDPTLDKVVQEPPTVKELVDALAPPNYDDDKAKNLRSKTFKSIDEYYRWNPDEPHHDTQPPALQLRNLSMLKAWGATEDLAGNNIDEEIKRLESLLKDK